MKQLHGLVSLVARNWFVRTFAMLAISAQLASVLKAQDLATLPVSVSEERAHILASLAPPPQAAPMQLSSDAYGSGLSPQELTYKRAAEHFALFDRRFVRCELKDHSVVTGAIVAVGPKDFIVRPGKLRDDRVIRYSDLGGPPRPTAAVGTHLKNGLQMTAMVAVCAALLPMCIAATGE